MKLCFIPPLNHLDLSLEGDKLFTLAQHAYKHAEYIDFYKKQDKYKIIDNGAAEKETVKDEILLEMAKEMKADEIVIPDKLFTGWKTTLMFKKFMETISATEKKKYRFMIVPQGKTKEQYLHCMHNILANDECPQNVVMGLSKFSAAASFGNRIRAVQQLLKLGVKNEFHLLGATEDLNELSKIKTFPQIRSNDSCISILSAVKGLKFTEDNLSLIKRPETENSYFGVQMSEEQIQLAKNNMSVYKKLSI